MKVKYKHLIEVSTYYLLMSIQRKRILLILDIRAGHLKWIVVLILQVIVVMFETTGGLV